MSEHQSASDIFANPVPLGLLGMSVGSAALVPMCFGFGLTPQGLATAAILALLFGVGGQALAGLMSFANRNLLGGTLFTTFTFLWIFNWWTLSSLGKGLIPDHSIILAMEITLFIVLSILTYAFGLFSSTLFAFLFTIDLLFVVRIIKTITNNMALMPLVGLLTLVMIVIALWLSFGMLVNPYAGKSIFPIGGPLYGPYKKT